MLEKVVTLAEQDKQHYRIIWTVFSPSPTEKNHIAAFGILDEYVLIKTGYVLS